jgi:hypothetical protein
VSALSLDTPVSLFEPAGAVTAPQARRGRPDRMRAARPSRSTTVARATVERTEPSVTQQHGRRVARPAAPRARRASAASTFSLAVLAAIARLVAVRSLGIGLAAAAVTFALAIKGGGTDAPTLASLSARGLAAAAILGAAWGFQDRPRLGTLQTVRAWYCTAVAIGAAHALWIETTMPGGSDAHLAAALGAFALDAALVATPALLGARAGRPDVPSTLA